MSADTIALIGCAYLCVLFFIAYFGDRDSLKAGKPYNGNYVYALSLAVYCSSWTFYGAVGTAAVDGLDYLTIYLGPCIVFIFGYPVVRRIILVCKQNSITTISDFLSSRYGKSRKIAVLVTCIAVVGSLPYIALQLKAVSTSYFVLSSQGSVIGGQQSGFIADNVALIVAAGLVLFTILFGTRHLDATEHHKGMILAIAFESIVKLVAIIAVGYYAMYLLIESGAHPNFDAFVDSKPLERAFGEGRSTWASFTTKLVLSMTAIILLPRQFQVAVVEARDHRQFKTAMWVMPVYLMLTSIIVIPIALSGVVLLPNSAEDMYVLSLPLTTDNNTLGLIAFIGGLSAATGMVIVAAISLSTMICNDLVMPLLIQRNGIEFLKRKDLNNIILLIRRFAILVLMLGAYGYFKLIDNNQQLANIGLVSFAAIFQFLPATLFAIFWRKAHSRGVFLGLLCGFIVWAYTLILPTILSNEVVDAWFGNSFLHPQRLFGLSLDNSLTHSVVWSLAVNLSLIVYFSLRKSQSVIEELQASRFFFADASRKSINDSDTNHSNYQVSPDALHIVAERIIGVRSTEALFSQYEERHDLDLKKEATADPLLISSVQKAIAGVIGTASAQRVISDSLLGDREYLGELTHLVDETSQVLKFNRDLLHTTLENITHGIAVVDGDLNLVIWNDNYLKMFDYPEGMIYVGKPIREVLEYSAQRGDFMGKKDEVEIAKRIKYLQQRSSYTTIREVGSGIVLKATGEPMPNGGFVTTYEDITESVEAAKLLRVANEELENRVRERTIELKALTEELERNTRSKTHFLAAASHDLLQPISAARLFAHSAAACSNEPNEVERLSTRIDKSLATANDLLRALLDISKLDAGGIEPEYRTLSVREFLQSIASEMQVSADEKELKIRVVSDNLYIKSDRQLLFSVMSNLVANALRYTFATGEVVLRGVTGDNGQVRLSVEDSGIGIDQENIEQIFNEFYQVQGEQGQIKRGLGLGLSIVRRICSLMNINIEVESELGKGSKFSVILPEVIQPEMIKSVSLNQTFSIVDRLQGASVLCLDNDENVLNGMQTMLEGWGCEVTAVLTYEDAIKAIQIRDYEVVLADYRLNQTDTGLDCLDACKHKSKLVQGILITAEQDKSLRAKTESRGFMYMAKPIAPASLKSLMMYLVSTEKTYSV